MPKKRYRLPQLGFFQGFEAAARNLSFTKAAEELFITQGKPLEANLLGTSTRIGINVAKHHPWRFFIKGNEYVSRGKPSA